MLRQISRITPLLCNDLFIVSILRYQLVVREISKVTNCCKRPGHRVDRRLDTLPHIVLCVLYHSFSSLTFDELVLPSLLQETVSKIDKGLSPATILIGRKRFIATRINP